VINRDAALAFLYFLLSTLVTWWFIAAGKQLYISSSLMIASCSIAGAKWGIQIAAALLFLKEKKWQFIKRIGFTCFVGSCILLPYCLFNVVRQVDNSFLYSLVAAVLTMICLYHQSVKKTGISEKWFWGWIACLATAISLQLFVIFKVLQTEV
jgi:hypothetical protein